MFKSPRSLSLYILCGNICAEKYMHNSYMRNPYNPHTVSVPVSENRCCLRLLAIYMGKPEIPDRKSNGLPHPVLEASENMGCDLRRCSFSSFLGLFSLFGNTL